MTEEEWALVQIIENPVLFREFINQGDPNWKGLELHERAWTSTSAAYLAMCCGRGVHKTTTMIELLYYWAINGMFIPGDPGLIVYVPNKAQKDSIFPKIRSACTNHWLMKRVTNQNAINEQVGRIEFTSGFTLILRIAGSTGTEANVISLHGARIWVDEAQDFPWRAWLSLGNVLKFDIPGHMMWVSGVPNGGRTENVLFECDNDDKYASYNVPQTAMSYWTPEIEYSRRKEYHALQEDSEDYKHYVLGQHGVPTFSVFDRNRFLKESYEIQKIVITQHMFDTAKRIDIDDVERYHIEEVIICPPLPQVMGTKVKVGLGYDPGYSPDPAAFFILYQDPITLKWKNLVRFILQKVEYALQRETVAWLDTVYKFDFIGIDMGGVGKVQYQDLTGELSDYLKYRYLERIFPVEFGGQILVAFDEEGNEKKDLVKRVAVETLSRWVHEGIFVFSAEDDDLMQELERTKFMRTITGDPVYKTENDHQMSAMMCAILAYINRFGSPVTFTRKEPNIKLMSAKWIDTRVGVN